MTIGPPGDPIPAGSPSDVLPVEPSPTGQVPGDPVRPAIPPVELTRRLVGASFDLLARASDEMRGASFYIGAIILGTVGPFALASWVLQVATLHRTVEEGEALMNGGVGAWYGFLAIPALLGGFAALVESRTMAAAILGGRLAGRPITVREALARSRMVFWRAVVASIVAGVPLAIAQGAVEAVLAAAFNLTGEATLVGSIVVTALVGAPLAYLLAGVVLGDVDPFEALRRSFRVFRARKMAAVVVALLETAAGLLILFGLSAGLDIALRVLEALGLGLDSGPAGLTLVTLGVAGATFALGTLIYTVTAIALAPQIVMFVGLTHATMGLDHVRPGGDRAPGTLGRGQRPFRLIGRAMLLGIFVAWATLLVVVALLLG